MPTNGFFSAWIMCDGKPLPDYCVQVPDDNASKVSCWIPSEAGKKFSVFWRDEGSSLHSCAFISLDGFVVPGRFLYGYGSSCRHGVRTGYSTERPFVFAQQANTSSGGQIHPDAGTIKLKIRWVVIEGSRTPNALQQLPEPSGSQGNVLSHCTSFAEQKHTYEQYPQTWNVKPDVQSGNRSDVTFVFHYRPWELLVSQGTMPLEQAIPPAVRRACEMSRRVASSPLPANSSSMTPTSNPSPLNNSSSEQTESVPQTALDPATRTTANTRAIDEFHNRQDRYTGEGVLNLELDPDVWRA